MKVKGITEIVALPIVVSASRCIIKGRCLVQSARLAAGSADATLKVYDGVDSNGRQINTLAAVTGSSDSDTAPVGDLCEMGVYLELSGTGAEAACRVLPLDSSITLET